MRIQRLLLLWLMVGIPSLVVATSEEKDVIQTVQRFFDAMASKDPVAARESLLEQGRFVSIRDRKDGVVLGGSTHDEFVRRLAEMEGRLLERMWGPKVRIHGRIATLWTAYDFHRDGDFSHCGIDAFSLVKTDGGWKIAGVVYTVEKDACVPSPLGPPR